MEKTNEMNEIESVDQLYGDGTAYDLNRLENEIRDYGNKAGEAFIEMGKRLIRIKAHEGHGKFKESLDRLDIKQRTAAYAMVAARKFSNSQTFANLSVSKIIALSVLEEKDIETIEAGGEVKGITKDNVGDMTSRELKENLKENKEKEVEKEEAPVKPVETAKVETPVVAGQEEPPIQKENEAPQPAIENELAIAINALKNAVNILMFENSLVNLPKKDDVELLSNTYKQFMAFLDFNEYYFTDVSIEEYLIPPYKSSSDLWAAAQSKELNVA